MAIRTYFFQPTITLQLDYAKKLAGKSSNYERSVFSKYFIDEDEMEKNRKREMLAEMQRQRRGKDMDNFFLDYASIRDTGAADSLAQTAKALDTNSEDYFFSGTSVVSDENTFVDLDKLKEDKNEQDVALSSTLKDEANAQTVALRSGIISLDQPVDNSVLIVFYANRDKIDFSRPLNADSTGEATLTDDQISELKSKYDLKNLTPQQQYDLFCDLTDMNVLSVDDIKSIGFRKFIRPPEGLTATGTSYFALHSVGKISDYSNIYDYLLTVIKQEQKDYDYMMNLGEAISIYGDRKPGATPVEEFNYQQEKEAYKYFEEHKDSTESLMNSHKKVAYVLSQLL